MKKNEKQKVRVVGGRDKFKGLLVFPAQELDRYKYLKLDGSEIPEDEDYDFNIHECDCHVLKRIQKDYDVVSYCDGRSEDTEEDFKKISS